MLPATSVVVMVRVSRGWMGDTWVRGGDAVGVVVVVVAVVVVVVVVSAAAADAPAATVRSVGGRW